MTSDIKKDFYIQGIDAKNSGDFLLAIDLLTKAIQNNLPYPDIYGHRSYCFSQRKQYARALEDITNAIEKNQNDFLLYYNRGLNHLKLLNYDLARKDFSDSIHLNPKYASSYFNRGLIHLYQNKNDDAISDFSEAINLEVKHYKAYYKRGVAQEKKGNISLALEDFDTSLSLNPEYINALEERAKLLVETGNSESALTDFETILKISPDNAPAKEKQKLVKKEMEELLSDSNKPDLSKLYYMRGLAKISVGNYQGAIEDYSNAIKIDPNNSNAYYYRSLARIANSKGDQHYLKEALKDQKMSLQLNPEDTKTLYFKAITEQTIHKTKSFQIPTLKETNKWIECYGASYPSMELGGDYFYIYKEKNESLISLTLGDVEGKGSAAAMFMSISLQLLDQARKSTTTPSQVMEQVNSQFIQLTGGRLKDRRKKKKPPYITAVYASIEKQENGSFNLQWVNAGHLNPILLRDNELLELTLSENTRNSALNLYSISSFNSSNDSIRKGDRVFFYSDGLIEENAGTEDKMFGLDKVKDWLFDNRNLPLKDQVEQLIRHVQKFGEINGQEDDITVVGIRVV